MKYPWASSARLQLNFKDCQKLWQCWVIVQPHTQSWKTLFPVCSLPRVAVMPLPEEKTTQNSGFCANSLVDGLARESVRSMELTQYVIRKLGPPGGPGPRRPIDCVQKACGSHWWRSRGFTSSCSKRLNTHLVINVNMENGPVPN